MLKNVLNELTQKYSLGYMAQPRSDAFFHLRVKSLLYASINVYNRLTLFLFQGSAERPSSAAQNIHAISSWQKSEIRLIFKGNLTKFCAIFLKITFKLTEISLKPLF